MELEINQTKHNFSEGAGIIDGSGNRRLSLETVMMQLYPDQLDGLAVAINEQVIAKNDWADTFLEDKTQLLVFTASQGG
jgi:thiamine biosynthesis protein ThiS